MVLRGSKVSPSFTLSNINMADRKLQLDGKIYRDPSPRPTMTTPRVTTQLAQEQVSNREEDWRRERGKARSKDINPREIYYQKDTTTAPRWREGENEWMKRERRQAEDKDKHVRALMNVQKCIEREMDRGMKKGETFPRMTNSYGDHGRRKMSDATNDDERSEKRKRDRQRQTETEERERAREREGLKERHKEGGKDEILIKVTEEGINTGRRPVEHDKLRRERHNELDSSGQDRSREVDDSRHRRERYAAGNRGNIDTGGKGGKSLSPHKQRAREIDTDRSEREKAQKPGQSRDTRSEGDSVERQLRRERARAREKENSKSERGNNGMRVWEGDRIRVGCKEDNGPRYRDKDKREVDRPRRREVEKDRDRYQDLDKREGEGWKRREETERRADLNDDKALLKDRDDYERRRREREADLRDETAAFQSLRAPRVPPRSLSSGERSSDMDGDMTHRRDRGGCERESERDNVNKKRKNAGRSQIIPKRSERHESDTGELTGSMPVNRRMWLDPQRDKNSKEEVSDTYKLQKERREEEESMESQTKGVREDRQGRQAPDEHLDQYTYRGRSKGRIKYGGQTEMEAEGVSVDGDDVEEVLRDTGYEKTEHLSDSNGWPLDRRNMLRHDKQEKTVDTTEQSDGEEGGGSHYFATAGCETPWKLQHNRTLSAEDYVTVSSDGRDEEEREEEDDADEEFQDCRELWKYSSNGTLPVHFKACERHEEAQEELTIGKEERVDEEQQGTEKHPKYVFCVIGQTLPRSGPGDTSPSQGDQVGDAETHNPELGKYIHCCDDATVQPHDDPYLTVSRNNEYPITSKQKKNNEGELNTSQEERTAAGEITDADIIYTSPAVLHDTEAVEETRSKVESNRDVQTERLLVQWREKNEELAEEQRKLPSPVPSNPYADVHSEVNLEQVLDEINAGVLGRTEKGEAVQIQIDKGWTMCEEPKRHSQAPHLKWAKNVVRDILGHSEEEMVDEPNPEDPATKDIETVTRSDTHAEELAHGTKEIIMLTPKEHDSDPELLEEDSLEELRGMRQRQGGTHSEQFKAFYDDTLAHSHAYTPLNTEGREDDSVDKEARPSGHLQIELKITCEAGNEVLLAEMESEGIREKEGEMHLSLGNTLYKPNSCPILNCESTSDTPILSRVSKNQRVEGRVSGSEQQMQGEEPEGWGSTAEVGMTGAGGSSKEGEVEAEREIEARTLSSTGGFRELGLKAEMLRGEIRKTAEGRVDKSIEEEEEEGVGRDRRTRIFSTTGKEGRWKMEKLLICSNQTVFKKLLTYLISPLTLTESLLASFNPTSKTRMSKEKCFASPSSLLVISSSAL